MYQLNSSDDLPDLLAYSGEIFDRFGFDIEFGAEVQEEAVAAAIDDGFTNAIALPAADWLHEHRTALATGFGSCDGWESPYVEVDDLLPVGRPAGPYILALHADPRSDDDLRGLTAPALHKALGGAACLTVEEYLVVQRAMVERFGDHRFDDYSRNPSGWMWLADSTDGSRTAMAYWNGSKRRVEVAACRTGSKNPRKGARRCRVIPLESGQGRFTKLG